MSDSLDDLMSDLAWIDSGWHRHVNPKTGDVALFPDVPRFPSGSKEARAAEDAWQSRALEMHASQVPVILAPKPVENALAGRVVRGD